ncbi:MAG: sodium-dependent bicarbonate transport family permease, partial [Limnohabitans sp.]
ALGLKGGFALAQSGLTLEVVKGLGAALLLAILVPLVGYQILKRLTSEFDAAAIAATYGSVSAVTFMTAVQFLDAQQVIFSGHMSAAMAVMESPAILLAVFWVNAIRSQSKQETHPHGLK